MGNFFIIRNKEKNMYYWGDGSWTKSKDCAKKYQHKDCAEILMQIDRLDYKICEVIEIPSIADLEAKLAESEKDRLMWEEMYKSADRQNKSICETDIYPLQEENQQLKDKLEIKLEELHIAYCGIENVKTKNGNLKAEVKQLKQQLAEKERIIVEQKIKIRALSEENFLLKDDVQMAIKMQNKHDIEKNQTAIEKLEKVKEWANNMYDGWKSNDGVNLDAKSGICNTL